MIKLLVSAILAGLLVTTTKAADTEEQATHAALQPSEFVKLAAQSDEFERVTGKLAAERAANEDVRAFGQQMSKDHSQSTEDLMQAVKEAGVHAPSTPPALAPDQKKVVAMLNDAEKSEFDALYLTFQAKAHTAALGMMKGYAEKGTNEVLAKAAGKTAPMIQTHLDRIHEIQRSMK
jgi:putative membrane protein